MKKRVMGAALAMAAATLSGCGGGSSPSTPRAKFFNDVGHNSAAPMSKNAAGDEDLLLAAKTTVCGGLKDGWSKAQAVSAVLDQYPSFSRAQAGLFVHAAVLDLCPGQVQHAG